ncbi:FAD-dependent oxidoreductase [Streptomyces brasiliensis]|uniref:FAD-binding protein n=1 Tax=Streptomyces brasiliensis TaxID=1954 RepID=A0A917P9A9_9ACTN|nr:FAD-dependent oxidoreductase [Streptomyces brasiliensis]GGJ67478.1 FAD-binding protein [Streptomyces brasiliensis]
MTEELEVDVVCVGSGVGGCAAAATAAHAGAEVLLVEKSRFVGGVTAYSGGQVWIPASRQQAELGIEDTVEDGVAYLEELAQGWGDHERTSSLLHAAKEALEYFEDEHAFAARVIKDLPDYYYPLFPHAAADGRYVEPKPIDTELLGELGPVLRRSPIGSSGGGLGKDGAEGSVGGRFVQMGEGLAAHFVHAAQQAGVGIWTESPARELLVEDGRVVGVRVATPDGDVVVRARKGVVLATGGYDWNPDMVHRFEGVLDSHGSAAPAGIEGDHIVMAAPTGAALAFQPASRNVMQVGFPTGKIDEDGHDLHSSYRAVNPHEIIVNRSGRRFANESFYPALSASMQTLDGNDHSLPNWPCWLIFDSAYLELGADRAPSLDLAVSADTIAELAELAGIDADGLAATVAAYNRMCAEGRDTEWGRGEQPWSMELFAGAETTDDHNPSLGPIDRAPFYAARMSRVQFGIGSAGLSIDRDARVLRYTGEPVEGLYAVGNSAGRDDVGAALQSGVANMRGLTYGYLAGKHAAARR